MGQPKSNGPRVSIKSEQLDDIVDSFQEVLNQNLSKGFNQSEATTSKIETPLSREIKILAEVEKIWIIYDIDGSGKIDQSEISEYLV